MKTVVEMAREAGWKDLRDYDSEMRHDVFMGNTDSLERFAELVRADERNKLAEWMIQCSYATGHGDTTEDLLKELEWQVRESEREACAKVCELVAREIDDTNGTASYIAAAIRARGQE